MQDTNLLLLVCQLTSLTASVILLLMLVLSRFQVSDTPKIYERVRWNLALAMALLIIHYSLQLGFGFRAQGDDVGALVNILFYAPVAYIFSYSQVLIGCGRGFRRQHNLISHISMGLFIGCFIFGYLHYNSLHVGVILHIMGALFLLTMVYFIVYPNKEIKRVSKLVDEESGQEPVQYNMYMRTGYLLLNTTCLLVPFCIYYTPAVAILGIIFFVVLSFYTVSFISLGFGIRQVKAIIIEHTDGEKIPGNDNVDEDFTKTIISDEQKDEIRALLDDWRKAHGYTASEINSTTLAMHLGIPKRQLVQYLREVEGQTFRVWLSDLRLNEAKRLIIKYPQHSNEAIAEACGFSRTRFQVKFKEATGFTINEWREMQKQ